MLLLETIRFENGNFSNIRYHQVRMNNTRKEIFGNTTEIGLTNVFRDIIKPGNNNLYKCRVVYDKEIRKIEFIPYFLPEINSLKLIHDNEIAYKYKYLDRSKIDFLHEQKGDAGDIIIVKNGLLTDTSYANILCLKDNRWYTPSKPLLAGTRRSMLLASKKIETADITPDDLKYIEKIRLINAMMRFEDVVEVGSWKMED
jgi:4-amino-4-deoxychorismate lyase